eukprot:SAG11_NODE_697_length_7684_cov_8.250231_8_plen_71_part_00
MLTQALTVDENVWVGAGGRLAAAYESSNKGSRAPTCVIGALRRRSMAAAAAGPMPAAAMATKLLSTRGKK